MARAEQSRQVLNQGAMPVPQSSQRPEADSVIASGSVYVRQSMTARAVPMTAKHAYAGPARHAITVTRAAAASSITRGPGAGAWPSS